MRIKKDGMEEKSVKLLDGLGEIEKIDMGNEIKWEGGWIGKKEGLMRDVVDGSNKGEREEREWRENDREEIMRVSKMVEKKKKRDLNELGKFYGEKRLGIDNEEMMKGLRKGLIVDINRIEDIKGEGERIGLENIKKGKEVECGENKKDFEMRVLKGGEKSMKEIKEKG